MSAPGSLRLRRAAWLAAAALLPVCRPVMAGEDGTAAVAAGGGGVQLFFSRLPLPAAAAAAALAALLVAAWWLARRQPAPGLLARRLLAALRFAAAAVLALALGGLALRTERREVERAAVYLLVDESQSMMLRDRYGAPGERQALEGLLGASAPERADRMSLANRLKVRLAEKLGGRFRVETYAFAERLTPKPTEPPGEEARRVASPDRVPAGAETRLGSCLTELLDGTGGQPVAGVVVLSDGCSNSGQPVAAAAETARARGVPVYTVGLGDPAEPRDIAVREVLADEVCLKGDPVLFRARIDSPGLAGRTVEAAIKEDGRVIRKMPVKLDGAQQQVEFTHTPEKAGLHSYALAFPVEPDEALADNNEAAALVRVEDARTRVLLIAGEPTWEYRNLVAALVRDKTVESSCFLQSADPTYPQEGSRPISRLPRGEADLYAYDVVVLCGPDPNPVDFSAELVEGLGRFVGERGGGLLFIASRRPSPYAFKGQRAEDLLKMLPAELDLSRDQADFGKRVFKTPWRIGRAAESAELPMLRLDDDPVENEKIWKELPELYWSYPVARLKPAAARLLVRPREGDAGEEVLSAVHYYGAGRTALVATDDLWRWRHLVGDRHYYRFWAQLVRHLATGSVIGRGRPVQLTADRALYRPGEEVELRAAVKKPSAGAAGTAAEAAMEPLRAEFVDLVVQRAGTDADEAGAIRAVVKLLPVPDRPGTYSGRYTVGATGIYETWMPDAPRIEPPGPPLPPEGEAAPAPGPGPDQSGAPDRAAAGDDRPGLLRFEVRLPARESGDLRMNREALEELAGRTGGESFRALDLAALDALAGRIPDRSREQLIRTEREAWDTLAVLALLLAGLGLEWALRKHWGMI
jgi:hypothetical protein